MKLIFKSGVAMLILSVIFQNAVLAEKKKMEEPAKVYVNFTSNKFITDKHGHKVKYYLVGEKVKLEITTFDGKILKIIEKNDGAIKFKYEPGKPEKLTVPTNKGTAVKPGKVTVWVTVKKGDIEVEPEGQAADTAIVIIPKVDVELVNKKGVTSKTYGTARYGLPNEYKSLAKVIIEGSLIDYPMKLVPSAGVKLDKPNQKYTSTTQFQFEVTNVSATKDDLSIKAVDKNNKVLAELKFMSYLRYKPKPQSCEIQHKDTNAPCTLCKKAGVPNHEHNKPHPNKKGDNHRYTFRFISQIYQ